MNSKLLRLLVPPACVLGLLAGCRSSSPSDNKQVDREMIVASDFGHPPFVYLDAEGRPAGRDVEMMEQIAQVLDLGLRWEEVPFEDVLSAVQVGGVDVGCATIGISPERKERMAFSRPYFRTAIVVLVRAGEGEPRTFAELAGKRVGAGRATTSERAVRRLVRGALCVPIAKGEGDPVQRLLAGELDALAMDGPDAKRAIESSGGRLTRIRLDLDEELYALALPFERKNLLRRIDAALDELERTGLLAKLDQEHGL